MKFFVIFVIFCHFCNFLSFLGRDGEGRGEEGRGVKGSEGEGWGEKGRGVKMLHTYIHTKIKNVLDYIDPSGHFVFYEILCSSELVESNFI